MKREIVIEFEVENEREYQISKSVFMHAPEMFLKLVKTLCKSSQFVSELEALLDKVSDKEHEA